MPARAVWLALAAAALFGASTPLAKALVGERHGLGADAPGAGHPGCS